MDGERTFEDFAYSSSFQFNEGTKIVLGYDNQPFFEREKGLTYIDGQFLGLDYINIRSTIKNPVEAIEQIFSANPLGYKSLPFQHTQFVLDKQIRKDDPLLKDVEQFRESLIIDRISCDYTEKEDFYKLTLGNFYSIVKSKDIAVHKDYRKRLKKFLGIKEKTFHTMSIYEVLPFTKREKEILSGMEHFEISYRFPRPGEDAYRESKHTFRFVIKKTEGKYELEFDMHDGFTSGLDLKSIWPAERLFDYLNSERKMTCLDERVTRYCPFVHKNRNEKTLHEKILDPMSLYKEDAEGFITYFSTRSLEEKKELIKNMMGSVFINEKVIAWLDKNEPELVREVGLKQV
ncbi:hypothetical protein FJZ53_06295 [Candidatus Woesearchaeota archaeon]|nr:hypothetical protein [Candidatus Woesearchaeota archaeon]